MRISFQVLAFPRDTAIEKFSSWVRHQLSAINAELPYDTHAEVQLQLPRDTIHRITEAGLDRLMHKEVNRHSNIMRIIIEEANEA